jgi:hypothetical protein
MFCLKLRLDMGGEQKYLGLDQLSCELQNYDNIRGNAEWVRIRERQPEGQWLCNSNHRGQWHSGYLNPWSTVEVRNDRMGLYRILLQMSFILLYLYIRSFRPLQLQILQEIGGGEVSDLRINQIAHKLLSFYDNTTF